MKLKNENLILQEGDWRLLYAPISEIYFILHTHHETDDEPCYMLWEGAVEPHTCQKCYAPPPAGMLALRDFLNDR